MTRSGRKDRRFCTTLPTDLQRALKAEAWERRVKQKEIVVSALWNFLTPPERSDRPIRRQLAVISERLDVVDEKVEVLSETLALFIQVWFSNTDEIPDAEKDAASRRGEKRFSRFLEILGRRINKNEGEKKNDSAVERVQN